MQEIKRRVEVLDWMRKNNIRVFKDVARIVSFYAEHPDEVMEKIAKGKKIDKENIQKPKELDKIKVEERELSTDLAKKKQPSIFSFKKKVGKNRGLWRDKNNSK